MLRKSATAYRLSSVLAVLVGFAGLRLFASRMSTPSQLFRNARPPASG